MCQVDSLQPPVVHAPPAGAAAAASATSSPSGAVALPSPTRPGARQSTRVGGAGTSPPTRSPSSGTAGSISSGGHTGPMSHAFVPPFGLPVHLSKAPPLYHNHEGSEGSPPFRSAASGPAGVASSGSCPGVYQCTWGCCPFDPPAVFASVGRGLAFALLELAGGTVAREGPSIAHPQVCASYEPFCAMTGMFCPATHAHYNPLSLPLARPAYPVRGRSLWSTSTSASESPGRNSLAKRRQPAPVEPHRVWRRSAYSGRARAIRSLG
jgi:hypothetical protein